MSEATVAYSRAVSKSKLGNVQYLRAFAALLVVAYHASGHMGSLSPDFPILAYGQYGVDLFFVLSGFIMAVTTDSKTSPEHFFRKRMIRIIPLYWLITIIYFCIALTVPLMLRSGNSDAYHFILSLLFVPHYNPVFPKEIWPLVIPGWSLNYEMFFYLIFTAALWLNAKYRTRLTIMFLLLLVVVGQIFTLKQPAFLTYTNALLLEFAIGVVIGETFLANARLITIAFILLLLVSVIAQACQSSGLLVWRPLKWGAISGCVLTFLLLLESRGVSFSNSLAIGVGDASYSIYLTHPAVVAGLRMAAGDWSERGGHLEKFVGLAAVLLLSSILGCFIYQLIERPMLDYLKRRIGRAPLSVPASI